MDNGKISSVIGVRLDSVGDDIRREVRRNIRREIRREDGNTLYNIDIDTYC